MSETLEAPAEARFESPEAIVAALSTDHDPPPTAALRAAAERWPEVRPLLHANLRACASGEDRSRTAGDLAFLSLYLMAQQRDTEALAPLCALAHRGDALEDVMGDGITEDLSTMLVALFAGDPAPLWALAEDPAADDFVRSAAFSALTWLTAEGALARDHTVARLRDLLETMLPRGRSFVWTGWVCMVGELALGELVNPARKLFSRGWIDRWDMNRDDFERDLRGSVAGERSRDLRYIDDRLEEFGDVSEYLSGWTWHEPEQSLGEQRLDLLLDPPAALPDDSEPERAPVPRVGRNDPCPCGSGRKYKKCCLAAVG